MLALEREESEHLDESRISVAQHLVRGEGKEFCAVACLGA